MKKRIIAIIMTAALVLALLPATAMAAGTVLMVKTPATIPRAGEAFTVTVDVTGNPGLCAIQFTLAYDEDTLECVQASLSSAFSGMISAANANTPDGAIVATASAEPMTEDGTLATFQFTAKKDVTNYGFALRDVVLTDANRSAVSYTASNATVEVPAGNQTPTVPQTPSSAQIGSAGQTVVGGVQQAETETAPQAVSFSDTAGHWGAEWIAKAAERGLFEGYPDGGFHPDAQISRGDYVLVLYRMAGEPEVTEMSPFADVHSNDYYAKAIAWAYSKGYVEGTGAGFAPQNSLTRQEAMKILYGYAGSPTGMEVMFTGIYDEAFADSSEIAAWAKPAMYWAVYNTILNGMDGGLNPTGTATRAQLAKILVEYQNIIK